MLTVPNLPYDVTTLLGQTRFHAADTAVAPDPDLDQTVFADAELLYCLAQSGQNPILAAALALESASTDAAKISLVLKTETTLTDMRQVATDLAARAEKLRALTGIAPAVFAPDAVFTTSAEDGWLPGTMDCW